jgi:hypothetical protein
LHCGTLKRRTSHRRCVSLSFFFIFFLFFKGCIIVVTTSRSCNSPFAMLSDVLPDHSGGLLLSHVAVGPFQHQQMPQR